MMLGLMLASAAALPTDCRNQTAPEYSPGGELRVMSYHIHYNTIASDQQRFYEAFIKQFQHLFNPEQYAGFEANQCPFGPNFGSNTFAYVCSLEGPYQEHSVGVAGTLGGSPWAGPQRAFFIPTAHIDDAWAWAQANKGDLDVLKHPNSGCMHDDHSVRAEWNSTLRDACPRSADDDEAGGLGAPAGATPDCSKTCAELMQSFDCSQLAGLCDKSCGNAPANPTISILNFPCNVPGTGCNDTKYPGPPACGCSDSLPLPDDAPGNACKGCVNQYTP
eukprot:g568.t1